MSTAVSGDGKYMAVPSASEMAVYDVATAKKLATMATPPDTKGLRFAFTLGLAFSPDNKELAALLNGGRIVVWSSKGKVVFDHVCAKDIRVTPYESGGLIWFPEGNGWLLGGHSILDRGSQMLVFEIAVSGAYAGLPSFVIDQKHVVAAAEEGNGGDYRTVTVPWNKIAETAEAAKEDKDPIIAPRQAVSLEFEIGEIRFSTPDEVINNLTASLTARLNTNQIAVKTSAPITFRVKYSEAAGKTKKVVSAFRKETGQSISETVGTLEVALHASGVATPFWKTSFKNDAGLIIKGEPSDANVRKEMFEDVQRFIGRMSIPTYIPRNPKAQPLPIVFDFEKGR